MWNDHKVISTIKPDLFMNSDFTHHPGFIAAAVFLVKIEKKLKKGRTYQISKYVKSHHISQKIKHNFQKTQLNIL